MRGHNATALWRKSLHAMTDFINSLRIKLGKSYCGCEGLLPACLMTIFEFSPLIAHVDQQKEMHIISPFSIPKPDYYKLRSMNEDGVSRPPQFSQGC